MCLKSLGAPWLYTGDLHSSYYATSKNNNCASDVFGCVSDKRVTTYIIFIYTYIFQKLDYVVEMSSFSLCHISLFQKVLVVCFLSCYYYYYTVFLSVIWSTDIYHHWESIYIPPHYPSVVLTDQVINYMQFTFTFLIVFFFNWNECFSPSFLQTRQEKGSDCSMQITSTVSWNQMFQLIRWDFTDVPLTWRHTNSVLTKSANFLECESCTLIIKHTKHALY